MGESTRKLLLVEDEAVTAIVEQKQLEAAGYSVVRVADGERAVEVMGERGDTIDLILMDIDLGEGIDGTQAAQQILSRHEVPLVFLSAHTEPEYVERTEQISSYGYVVKNSGAIVLLRSIAMAFRLFDAYREVERNKRRYEQLFRNMTSGLFLIEVLYHDDGSVNDYLFVDANPAVATHAGVAPEKFVGRTRSQVFPAMSAGWLEACSRCLGSGEPVTRRQYSRTLEREFDFVAFPYDEHRFAVLFTDVQAVESPTVNASRENAPKAASNTTRDESVASRLGAPAVNGIGSASAKSI